jgi:hypothetical protein
MFYRYPCSWCGRIFYTYSSNSDKEVAAGILYDAIKAHQKEYNEDFREHNLDDGKFADSEEIEGGIKESEKIPEDGYYPV